MHAPGFAHADEIHLWRFRTDQAALAAPRALSVLSADEAARAARYRFAAPRQRFCAGRIALRSVLAAYLRADAHTLSFGAGPHGKPLLAGAELQFNLSHSGQCGLIAVAPRRPLGCDIEAVDARLDTDLVARHCFSESEQARLARHADAPARRAAFFALWVAKEAYLKGLGTGLHIAPASFTLPREDGALPALPGADALEWRLRRLDLGPGYAGALAVGGGDAIDLCHFEWICER